MNTQLQYIHATEHTAPVTINWNEVYKLKSNIDTNTWLMVLPYVSNDYIETCRLLRISKSLRNLIVCLPFMFQRLDMRVLSDPVLDSFFALELRRTRSSSCVFRPNKRYRSDYNIEYPPATPITNTGSHHTTLWNVCHTVHVTQLYVSFLDNNHVPRKNTPILSDVHLVRLANLFPNVQTLTLYVSRNTFTHAGYVNFFNKLHKLRSLATNLENTYVRKLDDNKELETLEPRTFDELVLRGDINCQFNNNISDSDIALYQYEQQQPAPPLVAHTGTLFYRFKTVRIQSLIMHNVVNITPSFIMSVNALAMENAPRHLHMYMSKCVDCVHNMARFNMLSFSIFNNVEELYIALNCECFYISPTMLMLMSNQFQKLRVLMVDYTLEWLRITDQYKQALLSNIPTLCKMMFLIPNGRVVTVDLM